MEKEVVIIERKNLIIVSLILALLTIGVASASEDVLVVDELETSDIPEVPIEETSVDDVVEETHADNVLDEDEYSEPEHDPVDFEVAIKGTVDLNDEDDFVFNCTVPKEAFGNLHVYAGEYSELIYYMNLGEYSSGTIIQVSADDLEIGNTGTVFIKVEYEPIGGDALTLASGTLKTIKSNVEYIKINSSVDFSIEDNSFIEVSDYGHYLDGNVSVYVDDDLKLTRNISDSQEGHVCFTVNDLNLYNNISIGNHSVKVVYLKNNGKKHSSDRTVNFYMGPHFRSYYKLSVGENETFIVNYIKDFNGTATLYKGVKHNESHWKKGEEVGSSNFTDGVATIPFANLTKGGHVFILTISGSEEEHQIQVDVVENTPGISACMESQVIVGNNVVVNFTGPVSENQVRFYVDDKEYKSVVLATGVLNETISGLDVGTHKIRVLFEDGEKFYSNTFHITVKDKPIPALNNTFTNLTNDIYASLDVFEMEKSYKFNNGTDDGKKIIIDKDNFVINGNNHIIDGNGQVSIFLILGKNVTINNLKFVNGHSIRAGGAIIVQGGSLTLNNVTFINNTADSLGGDVGIVDNACVNFFNCNFIDSCSYHGSAVYLEMATVNMEYCNFTSKYFSHWGSIFTNQMVNELFIDNCIFNNIFSTYSPAVFSQYGYVTINNTKFSNLKANESAGAVAIRSPKQAIIENCLFVNTTSTKNAGALFIDVEGEGTEPITEPIAITVRNSAFNNVSSGFGGAFVQLTGNLTLEDSSFTNCSAVYDGGATYLSNVNAQITNCEFNSNKAVPQPNYQTSGGALYFDYGILNIADSQFNNNDASMASGILIYDSEYHLDNITFNNNNNPVYTYFDDIKSTIGQVYGNDTISPDDLNNTYYLSVIIGEGMKLNLTTNNIDVSILPTRFDLTEIGWVTPVRDQGNMGSCWVFGGVAALESALLKNTGIPYDLSENNMQDSMVIFSRYGSDEIESANEMIAAGYLLSWLGAFPQEYDVYDELGKVSPSIHTSQTIHVQDFVLIDDRNISIPGDPALKKAILKYGALAVLYDGEQEPECYNSVTGAFYHLTGPTNHAVALVGWDDNYPKENFATIPDGDGAWIIKNSWGTQCGDGGYMFISYYDGTLCPDDLLTNQAVAYVFENTMSYNKNYQYDFTGIRLFVSNDETSEVYGTPVTNVNNFVSAEDDLIAAVGTYFNQSGMDYTVKVAVNGAVVYTQSGVSPYRGYHTIKLDKYIPIKKGDKFSIYVTSMALGVSIPKRAHYEAGVSLTNGDDGSWKDLYQTYGFVACIKAYTLKDDATVTGNKNIAVDYDGGKYFSVKVTTADGHVVVGASVNFKINGQLITVRTDNSGIAKIKITEVPGKYKIKTIFNGKTYKNSITVKHVLKASNVAIKKKTAKKFTLNAALKINGKAVKGKWITFKFNGIKYKAKTNKYGIAQKTFNKKVINKLKKGKTYKIKVTYLKDTIIKTLKVK